MEKGGPKARARRCAAGVRVVSIAACVSTWVLGKHTRGKSAKLREAGRRVGGWGGQRRRRRLYLLPLRALPTPACLSVSHSRTVTVQSRALRKRKKSEQRGAGYAGL